MRRARTILLSLAGLLAALPLAAQTGWGPPPGPAGPAASMKRVAGDGQSGPAGVPLAHRLVVRMRDYEGRAAAGTRVVWRVERGGGSIEPRVAVADSAGMARARWTPGPVAGPQRATATVEGLGTVPYRATVRPVRLELPADTLRLGTGDTARLSARLLDARGTPLAGSPVTWRAARDGVVRLLDGGSAAGLLPGTALLRAESAGVRAELVVMVAPAVHGRVLLADGQPAADAAIELVAGKDTAGARADEAGRFVVRLPTAADGAAELSVVLEGHHPARVRFEPEELAAGAGLVLLPRRWTVAAGRHAGRAVEVDPRRAFAGECAGCSGFYWWPRGGGWPDSLLPVPAAFDRRRSHEPITAADSAAFWAAAGELETALGKDLFRPVAREELAPRESAVLVRVDTTLSVAGRGSAVAQAGDVLDGAVVLGDASLPRQDGGARITAHELVHALGFGHTCAWPSLMADPRHCPAQVARAATVHDAAYIELFMRVRALEREHGLAGSLAAAKAGAGRFGVEGLSAAVPPRK